MPGTIFQRDDNQVFQFDGTSWRPLGQRHSYALADTPVDERKPRMCGDCGKRSVIKDDDYLCPVCRSGLT